MRLGTMCRGNFRSGKGLMARGGTRWQLKSTGMLAVDNGRDADYVPSPTVRTFTLSVTQLCYSSTRLTLDRSYPSRDNLRQGARPCRRNQHLALLRRHWRHPRTLLRRLRHRRRVLLAHLARHFHSERAGTGNNRQSVRAAAAYGRAPPCF